MNRAATALSVAAVRSISLRCTAAAAQPRTVLYECRRTESAYARPLVLIATLTTGSAWRKESKADAPPDSGLKKDKKKKGTDTSQEGLREVSSTQASSTEPDLGTGPQEEGEGEEPTPGDIGHLSFTKASLFKLTLPLHPTRRFESSNGGERAHSVIFLLHSGQPLSYIASLIRAERPSSQPGDDQVASVDSGPGSSVNPRHRTKKPGEEAVQYAAEQSAEGVDHKFDQGLAFKKKEDKVEDSSKPQEKEQPVQEDYEDEELLEPHSASSPALGSPPISFHTRTGDGKRWSPATSIGDFLRDAARTGSFVISVGPRSIGVAVPSFKDRTRFLRASLYAKTAQIERLSKVKGECDKIAHEGSRRIAFTGAGILATWWVTVCYLTFWTELGWDTLEPVSYLVGLGTLGGGYFFFLFYNKEVSYRAVLTETMSRRQAQLYVERGFSPDLYSDLIEDVKQLRRTIKNVAREYGNEMTWDQGDTESGKRYKRALDIIRKREAQDAAPHAGAHEEEDDAAGDTESKGGDGGATEGKEPEQEQEEKEQERAKQAK